MTQGCISDADGRGKELECHGNKIQGGHLLKYTMQIYWICIRVEDDDDDGDLVMRRYCDFS